MEDDSLFSEEGDKDRYLITYSDLITLLLGLFIILYAISKVDNSKYEKMITAMSNTFGSSRSVISLSQSGGGRKLSPIDDALKGNLNKLIKKYNYGRSISLEENKRGIIIHILDDVLFTSGSAKLTDNSRIVLHRLADIVKVLPNDIRVEGHTDNVPISTGSFPSNWHLSITRALNTAYYLIKNEGLPPDKVSIVGYSKYKPIASNETAEGRAKNRRVDIVIIKK